MARKPKHEEHENHERWLVSYADFITLLFAFFVVMYSVSSVNEGKFRAVSQSIVEALNPMVNLSASTIRIAPDTPGGPTSTKAISIDMQIFRRLTDALKASEQPSLSQSKADKAAGPTNSAKGPGQGPSVEGHVVVAQDDRGVVVSLADAVAFEPGKAELLPKARAVLMPVAAALREFPNQVRVEGHTDNVPIRTDQFPSNWELSSARAVAIVRFLSEGGHLQPERLAANAYGEFHPAAPNDTVEGRALNRRVELVVITSDVMKDVAPQPDVSGTAPCLPSSTFPPGCTPAIPSVQDDIIRKLF